MGHSLFDTPGAEQSATGEVTVGLVQNVFKYLTQVPKYTSAANKNAKMVT